jgi:hypothetical protein
MTLILRFINFIFKSKKKKKKKSSFTSEEDFIGYEAFPSGYRDNLLKHNRENNKFCKKS